MGALYFESTDIKHRFMRIKNIKRGQILDFYLNFQNVYMIAQLFSYFLRKLYKSSLLYMIFVSYLYLTDIMLDIASCLRKVIHRTVRTYSLFQKYLFNIPPMNTWDTVLESKVSGA
jgi:hypothetical protein